MRNFSKLSCKNIPLGNNCGHNPALPISYIQPDHHKQRPFYFATLIENTEKFYKFPKKFLKKISYPKHGKRLKKSERREAVKVVAQVLIHHVDMYSLRVGVAQSDGFFRPLTLMYILKEANRGRDKANLFGLRRIQRAISDLLKAGYLEVTRRYKKGHNAEYIGLASIRKLTRVFFIHLGMSNQSLDRKIDYCRKKLEKFYNGGLNLAKGLVNIRTTHHKNNNISNSFSSIDAMHAALASKYKQMKDQNPQLSWLQLLKLAPFDDNPS